MVSPGRVAFTVFGLDIMWYGILIGIGFLISTLIAIKKSPAHNLDKDLFLDLVIGVIPAAIIGARAYYVIFSWESYAGNWKAIFNTREGGLAIHGGLIAGFIVAFIICKVKKVSYLETIDVAAIVIPLGQAIGRWGNFFNEEAHGVECDLPWAQIIDGVGYHPTFLYESIWCFLLFLFLLYFDGNLRKFQGQNISLYMILYSIERFFVEGLRTDSLMIGSLRQAQLISIVIFISGIALYLIFRNRYKKNLIWDK